MKLSPIITGIVALLLAIAPAAAQQTDVTDITVLNVHLADGSKHQYKLPDEPKMTIEGDNVKLTSAAAETTYLRKDVSHMDFGKYEAVSVEQVENDFEFSFVDNSTVVMRGEGLTSVDVHDTTGRRAAKATATADGLVTVDLSALPQGIYLLTTNTAKSIKIIKQ